MRRQLLRAGNTKLGAGIFTWSVPATDKVCRWATPACRSVCYAKKNKFLTKNVRTSLSWRLQQAKRPDFVRRMVAEIRQHLPVIVRIHVAGDFFSVGYLSDWVTIVRSCPRVTFLCYTRVWRNDEMLPGLTTLARQPNMRLWLSCDRDTGCPPDIGQTGNAYLSLDDTDWPSYPVELVLRNRVRSVVRKTTNGSPVCPRETGLPKAKQVTCTSCRYCLKDTKRQPDPGRIRLSLPVVGC